MTRRWPNCGRLKPALQLLLLERIASCRRNFRRIAARVARQLCELSGDCQWKELFESVSIVDAIALSRSGRQLIADGL